MVDITKISSLTNLNTSTGTKASSGTGTDPLASKGGGQSAEDLRDQFLKILLTQMQNQNPLDPMDTKEMTGQLAQFSSLEQQINTNSKLDSMLTAMNSTASTSAFNYIGQTAELNSKNTILEDGKADWNYTISNPAETVTIKVSDASGKVLYSKDMKDIPSGTYSFVANKDDFSSAVAEGQVLTFSVTAKHITGVAIRSDISTTVKVDGVESGPKGISLRAGGLLFSMDDVLRFKTAPVATPTPTPSPTPASTPPVVATTPETAPETIPETEIAA